RHFANEPVLPRLFILAGALAGCCGLCREEENQGWKSLTKDISPPMSMIGRVYLFLIILAAGVGPFSAVQADDDGPRFRGPTGQGLAPDAKPPLRWGAEENVAWKAPIPGEGWSSPIVLGNRVIVTYATDGGKSCHVLTLDRATGKVLWDAEAFRQV